MGLPTVPWLVLALTGGSFQEPAPRAVPADVPAVALDARPVRGATQSQIDDFYRGLERRLILDVFQRTAPDARWKAEAEAFLRQAIDWFVDGTQESSVEQLLRQGRALAGRGCKDPMVACFTAQLTRGAGFVTTSGERLADIEAAFEATEYPRSHLARLRTLVAEQAGTKNDPEGRRAALRRACDAWFEWLRSSKAAGLDPRYQLWAIRNSLADSIPRDDARALIDRCTADPAVDAWVARTLEGIWEKDKAWDIRGGKWAVDVKQDQWEGFGEHLALARRSLTDAYKMAPDRPEPAAEMIAVSMGQSRDDHRQEQSDWFERASTAQFDYMPAYDAMFWALRPRWGGSHTEMLAFGQRCRASGRYDTSVPFQFVRAITDVAAENKDMADSWARQDVLEVSLEVIRRTAEAARRSGTARWYLSYGAGICWWARKWTDAYPLLEKAGFSIDPDGVAPLSLAPDMVARDTMTYGGPAAETYTRAIQAATAGDFSGAVRFAQQAVEQCAQAPAPVLHAARSRAESIRLLADFESGEWITPDLAGERLPWRLVSGAWSSDKTPGVVAANSQESEFAAALYSRVGRRVEVEVTIGFRASPKPSARAGILVGFDWSTGSGTMWQSVLLNPVAGKMTAGQGVELKGFVESNWEFTKGRDVRLRAVLWDDDLTVSVDDAQVYRGPLPNAGPGYNSGACVGLYARTGTLNTSTRFSNFRLRKLTTRPAPPPGF